MRYLDLMEEQQEQRARALGKPYTGSLKPPYRWRDWAAPFDIKAPYDQTLANKLPGWKRRELSEKPLGAYLAFVNEDLFPYLKSLGDKPGATNQQKVIAAITASRSRD